MKQVLIFLVVAAFSAAAQADTFGEAGDSFKIDFARIGDPGNLSDTNGDPDAAGSVDYVYRIGKHQITGKLLRRVIGFPGTSSDLPATSVSWFDAAYFVNQLNTMKGYQHAYKLRGRQASPGIWGLGDPGYDPANPYRNTQAAYFLPTDDEWYKAAFYDPESDMYAAASTGLQSSYGTIGQRDSVAEWEETAFDFINDSGIETRGVRSSGGREQGDPTLRYDSVGFRVASVVPAPTPEPGAIALGAWAAAAMLAARRYCRVTA